MTLRESPRSLADMRIAVIGAGVVGLAITYELVKMGQDVDCFEAGAPMGARSCGDTRIFRLAHDRPELVDWAAQAHRIWQEWSVAAGFQLVGSQRTVVSGDIDRTAAAMSAAGASLDIVDAYPSLPAAAPMGPFLVDHLGGVIRASVTGDFLLGQVVDHVVRDRVAALRVDGAGAVLTTAAGERRYDSVVVAAGAGTPALMEPLGVEVPVRLEHHVRLTFQLRDSAATPPCWLDRSEAWRPRFTSYGQQSGVGHWAVGGHLPDEDTAWALSSDEAVERATRWLRAYVSEYVTGCWPAPVDVIYCNVTSGLGDGLSSARVGPVLALWGDNLFKMAPIIGRIAAGAAIGVSLPAELEAVAHDTEDCT